jgi:chromosome partitioning protein
MILSVVSLKGGSGKTTTAIHLAACAARESPTVIIDADEEHSASRWAAHAELPFKVIPAERNSLGQQARALANDGTVVVIDTPPNNREIMSRASILADVVVVPVKPTGLDVDRLLPTLELLKDAEAVKGELTVGILFTHWDSRRVLAHEAREALEDFPVLDSKVRFLARYEQSFGTVPSYLIEYADVWRELKNAT